MRTALLLSTTEMLVMDGTPKEVFSRVKELKKYSLDVPQVTELADDLKEAGVNASGCESLPMDELMDKLVPILHEKQLPKQL